MKLLLPLLLTSLIAASCATSTPVGVRAPFRDARVSEVTVVDFYATANFGMNDEELEASVDTYEAATLAWLARRGTKTYSPSQLRQRLESKKLQQTFEDGVLLDRSLSQLFEPREDATPLESETLKALAGQGAFPTSTLLFGEVVYQTEGICEGDAAEHNPHARVLEPLQGATPPTSCLVSHIDAKLVDTASGATMWHNRLLIEQWYRTRPDGLREATIVRVVELVLEGEKGVEPLLANPST